jgi:GNAT superfamily N-acetyltransferase
MRLECSVTAGYHGVAGERPDRRCLTVEAVETTAGAVPAEELAVRSATAEDLAAVVHLLQWGGIGGHTEDSQDLTPYLGAFAEIQRAQRNELLVAEKAGAVVGFCQLFAVRHLQAKGGLCAELESVHVHPEHRGQGIGRHLISVAVSTAASWGCYRLQLTSDRRRCNAHLFYRAVGFAPSHLGFKLNLQTALGMEPQAVPGKEWE